MSGLRDHLRGATREQHHSLDTHPLLHRLMRPSLERSAYAAALRGLGSAVQPLEEALTQSRTAVDFTGAGWAPRLPLLLDDLQALGEPDGLHPAPPPRLRSVAEVAGVLYVLEGSRLGGQVLARQMAGQPAGPYPHRFFLGAAVEHPAASWERFLMWAEQAVPPTDWSTAATAAQSAFTLFRQQLELEMEMAS